MQDNQSYSLIKFQPSHGSVDFLGNSGAFRWENLNPDSCFYFKAANSLSKQKSPLRVKFKKVNSLEEKLADLVLLSSDKKIESTHKNNHCTFGMQG